MQDWGFGGGAYVPTNDGSGMQYSYGPQPSSYNASSNFDPSLVPTYSNGRSHDYRLNELGYYADRLGGIFGGQLPSWNPTTAAQYGSQLGSAAAAQSAAAANAYMPQLARLGNQAYSQGAEAQQAAYNTAMGAAPGMSGMLGARNALLQQQQSEAMGSAPQYLVDFWKQQAGDHLSGTMGAFGNSGLGATQMGNAMAANLYQYHMGAQQALGNTINNWNPYMNQVAQNNTANTLTGAFSSPFQQSQFGLGTAGYGTNIANQANTANATQNRLLQGRFIM